VSLRRLFSSLSRDHGSGGQCRRLPDRRLSTPSLGITLGVAQILVGLLLAFFQLPLSGSREAHSRATR